MYSLHEEQNMAQCPCWPGACGPQTIPCPPLMHRRHLMNACQLASNRFSQWERSWKGEVRIFLLPPLSLWKRLWPGLCVSHGSSSLLSKSNVVPTSLGGPNHQAPITSFLCQSSLRVTVTACSCQTCFASFIPVWLLSFSTICVANSNLIFPLLQTCRVVCAFLTAP